MNNSTTQKSTFQLKENTGLIFKNKLKKLDSHPDLTGEVAIDRTLIQNLLNETQAPTIIIKVGAYKKQTKSGDTFLSLYVSKPTQIKTDNSLDDDIPF